MEDKILKYKLVSIVIISVICIGLCGCEEKNDISGKDSGLEKFIFGSWQFVEFISVVGNNSTSSNSTNKVIYNFCENNSMKIVTYYYYNESKQGSYDPMWLNYKIENNLLFIDFSNYTNESVKGANISFSENREYLFVTTLSTIYNGVKYETHLKFKKLN